MPTTHAILPPSAAHRWLMCTPSARLEEHFPDRDTAYAEEGTYAHALAAAMLKYRLGISSEGERGVIRDMGGKWNTEELKEAVASYVSHVWEAYALARRGTPDARLFVERPLDLSDWIPEGFGTSDAVLVADGTMEVFDLKYGKGVRVESRDNPQMMIYALGALAALGDEFDIRSVRMTIVQPRVAAPEGAEIPADMLLDWGETVLRPRAGEAYRGQGRQRPGAWCRFCRAAAQCRALRDTAVRASASDPRLLSSDELASEVLPALPAIRIWLSAVEEHTLAQAIAGVRYAGYKLVEGRSVRRISDPAGCADALLANGYTDVWRPRELKTITELVHLVGGKRFDALCGQYITKPAGKPALVPEDDRREEWSPAADDLGAIDISET